MRIRVQGTPGSERQGTYRIVTQNTGGPTAFHLQVLDLGQLEGGLVRAVPVAQGARSCASWLQVDELLLVPANGRVDVPLRLSFPQDARGSYFAMVSTRLDTGERPEGVVVSVQPTVDVIVEAVVPGTAPAHVDVTSLTSLRRTGGTTVLEAALSNRGLWTSTVEGDLLLYPKTGGFPIRASLPTRRGGQPLEVFPGLSFSLRVPIPDAMLPGEYRAVARLILNGRWRTHNEFTLTLDETGGGARLLRNEEFDVALRVEPHVIELPLPPGALRTVPIRLYSQDPRPVDVRIEVSGLRIETNGLPTFLDEAVEQQDWVVVRPTALRLPPGRMMTLRTSIRIPRDAEAGPYLGRAIRIRGSAESTATEWSSVGEMIVLIVAVPPGAKAPQLELDPIELLRSTPRSNPSTALVHVHNTGGRLARLEGLIELLRASGEPAASMQLGGARPEYLLPGGTRIFRFSIPNLDEGEFIVRASLKHDSQAPPTTVSALFTSSSSMPVGLDD